MPESGKRQVGSIRDTKHSAQARNPGFRLSQAVARCDDFASPSRLFRAHSVHSYAVWPQFTRKGHGDGFDRSFGAAIAALRFTKLRIDGPLAEHRIRRCD
jgi:hypothetical protein